MPDLSISMMKKAQTLLDIKTGEDLSKRPKKGSKNTNDD